ncbi:MAG: HAD hydrolase-like protein, partial [Verrucomicrobiota bacterium]
MHLLFDLDGTLSDPFPGISRCLQHALVSLGRPAPSAEGLRWSIGPPLQENLAILLDSSDQDLIAAGVAHYRERFGTVGLFENKVYPGIEVMLAELKGQGHTLGVATSKPTVFARRIVNHFRLAKYFNSVDGSELDGTRRDKGDLLAHLLRREAVEASDAVMIGDLGRDIAGARRNGVAGVGVLWGYGSKGDLEIAGALACAATPEELPEIIQHKLAPDTMVKGA